MLWIQVLTICDVPVPPFVLPSSYTFQFGHSSCLCWPSHTNDLQSHSTFPAQLHVSQWQHIQYIPDTANNYTRCYQLIYLILPIPIPDSTNTYPWFYQYLSLILPLHIPDTTTNNSWCYHYLSLWSLVSKPDAWLKTCTYFCGLENKTNLTANSS